jgi:hypothetical protein
VVDIGSFLSIPTGTEDDESSASFFITIIERNWPFFGNWLNEIAIERKKLATATVGSADQRNVSTHCAILHMRLVHSKHEAHKGVARKAKTNL